VTRRCEKYGLIPRETRRLKAGALLYALTPFFRETCNAAERSKVALHRFAGSTGIKSGISDEDFSGFHAQPSTSVHALAVDLIGTIEPRTDDN